MEKEKKPTTKLEKENKMSKKIWKFELGPGSEKEIEMPKGAVFLHLDIQNNGVCMWFLVDTKAEREIRRFKRYNTGEDIPDEMDVKKVHIGTYLTLMTVLVFHVFEIITKKRITID